LVFENFKMVVRSFCFGINTFSPFGINRQNGELESPLATILPLWGLILSPPLVKEI
jgi:hypothetical protein